MADVAAPASANTVGTLLVEMAAVLAPALGADAAREARELLAALHDMPRHWPSLARGETMDAEAWRRALAAAARRARGAPLAYAAGQATFRHLTLVVDERVLIPRPETEQLVEMVLRLDAPAGAGGTVVDVGTGSGAIALALASEGAFARVIATDVSLDALSVAGANVRRCAGVLRTPVELRHGSLLGPVPERGLRVVVSNPPYISLDEASTLPPGVRDWEPSVALFSGGAGMATIAALVREAAPALAPGGLLALEVDARRASLAAELAATHGGYDGIRVERDLTGRERFVVARRREEQG
ncbi:MAG: peptide chain release factor N(5)-glutamine methyltransferase [Gemmatimonadaceae bacterium]|nr:peptide chain release factor N(5)-glutamine methyltransferase [Gemmatimonadaceae bacterium]NUR35126.1 peptide chain release factor N(5)-glutamine methyltransferase [Gemmatimonadaceae bacterium]